MNMRTADEDNDQAEIADDLRWIADMRPPSDQLVLREDTVKATLALSRRSAECLKHEAARQHLPYQRRIRTLVDA
jgi:predicted DNA binding CopG/RHH family protein